MELKNLWNNNECIRLSEDIHSIFTFFLAIVFKTTLFTQTNTFEIYKIFDILPSLKTSSSFFLSFSWDNMKILNNSPKKITWKFYFFEDICGKSGVYQSQALDPHVNIERLEMNGLKNWMNWIQKRARYEGN